MHSYLITINEKPVNPAEYCYKYNKKKITLDISEGCFSLSFSDKEKKDPAEISARSNVRFADAVKKACLLHIIKYSRNLDVRKITVDIDGKEYCTFDSADGSIFIYSLAEGTFWHDMPENWRNNDDFINALLNIPKTVYDSRMSSVFALICSKVQKYESERFSFLWMAVNGMYNYLWSKVLDQNNRVNEKIQLCILAELYGCKTGDLPDGDNNTIILNQVKAIINDVWDYNTITPESLRTIHSELASKIESKFFHRYSSKGNKKIDFKKYPKQQKTYYNCDLYSYLFAHITYKYRCDLFHSNTPVKLFSFEEEEDIKMLKVLNGIMEDFIEKHLADWFSPDYIEKIKPDAERIAAEIKSRRKS